MKAQIVVCTNRPMDWRFVDCVIRVVRHPEISIAFGIESLISRSRSVMASKFLETDNDVLIFIDDDIVDWGIEDINQIVADVAETGSVVGGCYPIKSTTDPRICALGIDTGQGIMDVGPQNGLIEIRYAATGFMAIHRQVLEKLTAEMKQNNFYGDLKAYPLFKCLTNEGVELSEDYSFCERAARAGFKIWLDPRISLGHVGSYVYRLG